eukprot:2839906-Rhodomonas_salina.4
MKRETARLVLAVPVIPLRACKRQDTSASEDGVRFECPERLPKPNSLRPYTCPPLPPPFQLFPSARNAVLGRAVHFEAAWRGCVSNQATRSRKCSGRTPNLTPASG